MVPELPEEERRAPGQPRPGGRRWEDNPEERHNHEWCMGDLGARIYSEREWRGWSREELARLTRTDPKSIADIENGRGDPRLSTITRIFRAFTWYARVLPEPMSPAPPKIDPALVQASLRRLNGANPRPHAKA